MTLYLVSLGHEKQWVAWEGPEARLYVYVPNTGAFHYNAALSSDFAFDEEMTYTPITAAEALEEIRAGVGHLDGRKKRSLLEQFQADQNAQPAAGILGTDPLAQEARRSRHELAAQRAAEVAALEEGQWYTWASYPADKRQTAYVAASDIRNGKIAALAALGPILARVVPADDGRLEVQVTRA